MITLPFLFKVGQGIINEKQLKLRDKISDLTLISSRDALGIDVVYASVSENTNKRVESPLPAQLLRLDRMIRLDVKD